MRFFEAYVDHFVVADREAGCSRVLPITVPLSEAKIAARINLNRSSVPLSPINILPLSALKNSNASI